MAAAGSSATGLMLADIMPTSFEVGVRNGTVKPGDTVAIVGAGPIGLAAITNAQLFSPSSIIVVDKQPARLDAAKAVGADVLVQPAEAAATVDEATGGLGADVVIEAGVFAHPQDRDALKVALFRG